MGDQLIRHVGEVLKRRLRRSDILARPGGDEFAVILPQVDSELAERLATEFVARIEQHPFAIDGHRYVLSASAGVVVLGQSTASAEDALVSADIALYDAKQQGRNRVAVFSSETRQDVLAGLTWSQLLKEALAHNHFILHAQPIVSLTNGETAMRELLIRMTGEDGELVSPNRFLPAAARFGYMPQIDRWVIAQAARLAAEQPGRCLTVNLAANTIAEPGLVAFITNTLKQTGADPADLVFEISEADVISNLDHACSVCERLRALGARIAPDDFGSGFSGFSYLKAMQVDLLKIDGQFVKELASNRVDQLIIEAILHVGPMAWGFRPSPSTSPMSRSRSSCAKWAQATDKAFTSASPSRLNQSHQPPATRRVDLTLVEVPGRDGCRSHRVPMYNGSSWNTIANVDDNYNFPVAVSCPTCRSACHGGHHGQRAGIKRRAGSREREVHRRRSQPPVHQPPAPIGQQRATVAVAVGRQEPRELTTGRQVLDQRAHPATIRSARAISQRLPRKPAVIVIEHLAHAHGGILSEPPDGRLGTPEWTIICR